jgi:hypothetical protein
VKTPRFIAILPALLLASCAADSDKEKSATPAETPHKSLTERMTEKNGYTQDAQGNWKAKDNKRSPFESKGEATAFKKDYKKQDYKTGDYAKKSWWGNKDYDKKSYSGKTDGSRFQQASSITSKTARETTGTSAEIPSDYKTYSFGTHAAREADTKDVSTSTNAAIEKRRKSFQQPDIIDWREQRSLSLDQSKSLLGR